MTIHSKSFAVGIDLGGTNLRAAAVEGCGRILVSRASPVRSKSAKAVVTSIVDEVKAITKEMNYAPCAIGCGIPGIVDYERGIVFASPHFPKWRNESLRDAIAEATHLPVAIDNDANCHALAEAKFGAGRDHKNMMMLTLGTGIGGGIVIDGKVFHGDSGFAGEVGHIVSEPNGGKCGCGGRGCWELYAASQAFTNFALRLPASERKKFFKKVRVPVSKLTPEIVANLAAKKDLIALKFWKEYGRYLGIGIATIVNVLGIFTFVIGGGITKSWKLFIAEARRSMIDHTYKQHAKTLILARSKLGSNAGVIGAALIAGPIHP